MFKIQKTLLNIMIKNKNMAVLGIIKTITLKKTSKID
jgi:hypothetical protein